jgi:hypothetical protein
MTPRGPDFLIVGTMKSGTTSLGYHLGRHESICIPRGEVHFFDRDANFRRGPEWYRKTLLRHGTERTRVFGEKTPTYSYQPNVAARIHGLFPDVKLIWIFREPVSRAYSNYLHAFREGAIRMRFEDAVAREAELIREDIFFGYLERGRYYKQVERFLELFPRENMHFMVFEEFVRDTRRSLLELFRFIGVSEEGFRYADEPRGKTVLPRYQPSVWLARRIAGRGALFGAIRWLNTIGQPAGYPALPEEIRLRLAETFAADNEKLSRLIDRDLSIWNRG